MRENSLLRLVSFILIAVYLVSCMFLVTVGVGTYRSISETSEATDAKRMSVMYVTNKIRSANVSGAVRLEERNGLNTLVLDDSYIADCETLIYFYDGALYELFKFKDADIEPQYGTVITELNGFEFNAYGNTIQLTAVFEDDTIQTRVNYLP